MNNISFKKNGFDIIRYWAAFSVMFLHYSTYAFQTTEHGIDFIRGLCRVATFFPGVVVLFSMSGYLIAASFERSQNKKDFFVKRVFRMYPELWVCTIVNLLVVCVLAYPLLDKSIFIWLGTQMFGIANTPSCLDSFATGSVNGALWTIFTEVQLYIVLGFTYNKLKTMKTTNWVVLLIGLALCNVTCDYLTEVFAGGVTKIIERLFLPYAIWFFIGVFCYVKRDWILPILKKYSWCVLVVYIIVYMLPFEVPGYYKNILIGLILPFLVIAVGYCLPKIRVSCDLSYEMFLYHWIVLNVVVHFDLMNKIHWILALILFTVLTLLLSWLSWRFVGKGRKCK